jgi:hypothetical protein
MMMTAATTIRNPKSETQIGKTGQGRSDAARQLALGKIFEKSRMSSLRSADEVDVNLCESTERFLSDYLGSWRNNPDVGGLVQFRIQVCPLFFFQVAVTDCRTFERRRTCERGPQRQDCTTT